MQLPSFGDVPELLAAAVLLVLGSFGWRYLRSGSLVGALLGGRVRERIGETTLRSGKAGSSVVRVQLLDVAREPEPRIALSIVNRSPFGASMVPVRLTRAQAQELSELLLRATRSF